MSGPLVLVPTRFELDRIEPQLHPPVQQAGGTIELCGFGVVAAAARTSQLIAQRNPARIVLVGIAGAFAERVKVGRAYGFDEVACYGIGAGSGAEHQSAAELGFRHWEATAESDEITDAISLTASNRRTTRQLLTVCAASSGNGDVRLRQQKWPDAAAEDMEGFAVASACQLAKVPLRIIRGISNIAGDRDTARWQIEDALQSAAQLVLQTIALPEGERANNSP